MKDRVKQVQDHYRLSQKQFAAELSVAEATISSIYRGRTSPTNNLIQAIHTVYPAVNINWLMFGEGEMLLPLTAETAVGEVPQPDAPATVRSAGAAVGQNVGFSTAELPGLFDAPAPNSSRQNVQKSNNYSDLPTELRLAEAFSQLKKANELDKPARKIKEIRVFFDDGTYEAFCPSTK